jgi:hypothetical protein
MSQTIRTENSLGTHEDEQNSERYSQIRQSLYPLDASWSRQPQLRIPIEKVQDPQITIKKTPKHQIPTLSLNQNFHCSMQISQKQLTLESTGWIKQTNENIGEGDCTTHGVELDQKNDLNTSEKYDLTEDSRAIDGVTDDN